MPTGYRYNGVDLEDILERTKDSSTDNMTNFNTDSFRQDSSLLPLSVFVSGRNFDFVSYDEEVIDFSSRFLQYPTLSILKRKGTRPRIVNYTWSLEKYGNTRDYEWYGLTKGTIPESEASYGYTPGEYLVITHRSKQTLNWYQDENDTFEQEYLSASDLDLEVIPSVIFFELTGAGGGGGGGANYFNELGVNEGGGGGGGAIAYGYIPIIETSWDHGTFSFNELMSRGGLINGVLVGKGGSGGDGAGYWSGWGTDGGKGKDSYSRVYMFSGLKKITGGNGGQRGRDGGGGAGGAFAINSTDLVYNRYLFNGIAGADGGDRKKDGSDLDYSESILYETLSWSSNGGVGDTGDGGGGGASKGDGGNGGTSGSGSNGNKGSGGGGGEGQSDGGDGGDGVVTFFY